MSDVAAVTTRWINLWEATPAEIAQLDFITDARGWMRLNTTQPTTRALVKEVSGRIVAFSVIQLMPFVGPFYISPEHRGAGLADELADETVAFLRLSNARGWLTIAESPHAEKLCEAREWPRVEHPVYIVKEGG